MLEKDAFDKIHYLDIERGELWKRVVELEQQINERPSDLEKEAKYASKKTAEFRNRAEERLSESEQILSEIIAKKAIIDNHSKAIEDFVKGLGEINATAQDSSNEIGTRSAELLSLLESINKILEDHPDIEDEIEQLEKSLIKVEEDASKATSTYKGILSKKSEIDELHREIIGYEDEDDDGKKITVEGLKSKLESVYDELTEKSKLLNEQIVNLETASNQQYNDFVENNQEGLDKLKESFQKEYDSINARITSLLPDALTAGLSSAFVKKKQEEEKLFLEYKKRFSRGILYLSLTAILPIAINIFFLFTDVSLADVIDRSPKVILAFMPLYVPLVWTTISANKKVNLSKRLIEEYSHKQVLGMTIEGLSNQIDTVQDQEISEELRIKLLNNFLNVSSENPGKLILNYQKSDNPVLNFFDRERSSKKTIVETMEENAKEIIDEAAEEVKESIKSK